MYLLFKLISVVKDSSLVLFRILFYFNINYLNKIEKLISSFFFVKTVTGGTVVKCVIKWDSFSVQISFS